MDEGGRRTRKRRRRRRSGSQEVKRGETRGAADAKRGPNSIGGLGINELGLFGPSWRAS